MKWYILSALILVSLILCFNTNPVVEPLPIINQPVVEIKQDTYLEDLITEVNKNIPQELQADAVVYVDGMKSSVNLCFKAKNNFRMLFYGIFNSNILDMGSNENIFWFWSKHYNKSTLYWAPNEEYNKTRLKTPFNPIWIRTSLGFEEIDREGWEYGKNDRFTKLTKVVKNNLGMVKQSYLIDNMNHKVVGLYVYDLKDTLLISSEWTNDYILKIIWYEEYHQMTIVIPYKIGHKVDNGVFTPPNKSNYIDMSKM